MWPSQPLPLRWLPLRWLPLPPGSAKGPSATTASDGDGGPLAGAPVDGRGAGGASTAATAEPAPPRGGGADRLPAQPRPFHASSSTTATVETVASPPPPPPPALLPQMLPGTTSRPCPFAIRRRLPGSDRRPTGAPEDACPSPLSLHSMPSPSLSDSDMRDGKSSASPSLVAGETTVPREAGLPRARLTEDHGRNVLLPPMLVLPLLRAPPLP